MDSLSCLIWAVSSLLGKTWRVSFKFEPNFDPRFETDIARIYCFWHCQLLPISYILRNSGKTALVSSSRDGLRAAAIAKMWNHEIIHGSSSHGGTVALRQCLRYLSKKKSIGITPDGPKGPKEIVKTGVAQIAHLSGAPVITIKIHSERVWRLNSWDRFVIPKPFARINLIAGAPIWPESDSRSDDPVESLRLIIQERLGNGNLA